MVSVIIEICKVLQYSKLVFLFFLIGLRPRHQKVYFIIYRAVYMILEICYIFGSLAKKKSLRLTKFACNTTLYNYV